MFDQQVIVITGASSGIGKETARLIAKYGAVPILTARSKEKLERVAQQIKAETPAVQPLIYEMDVTSEQQVQHVIQHIISRYGKIDVWINNAGYGVFAPIEQLAMEEFEEMMNVNYLGTVRCTKAILPFMEREGSGHIINVASVAGKIGTAKSTAYSATKHAVIGFTESLRQELQETGMHLSTFCPGPIDTPFFDRADPSGAYKKNVSSFLLTAQEAAWELVHIINKKPLDRTIPGFARFGVMIYQLFPKLFNKVISKQLNRK